MAQTENQPQIVYQRLSHVNLQIALESSARLAQAALADTQRWKLQSCGGSWPGLWLVIAHNPTKANRVSFNSELCSWKGKLAARDRQAQIALDPTGRLAVPKAAIRGLSGCRQCSWLFEMANKHTRLQWSSSSVQARCNGQHANNQFRNCNKWCMQALSPTKSTPPRTHHRTPQAMVSASSIHSCEPSPWHLLVEADLGPAKPPIAVFSKSGD